MLMVSVLMVILHDGILKSCCLSGCLSAKLAGDELKVTGFIVSNIIFIYISVQVLRSVPESNIDANNMP